jgi:hypothetical protein
MRTIIYIIEQPLTKWNYDRFGMEIWSERGWKLEVWNLTQLLNPNIWRIIQSKNIEVIEFNGHHHINNNSDLDLRFKTLKGGEFYISAFEKGYFHLRMMRRLRQFGAMRIHLYLGYIPQHPTPNSLENLINRLVSASKRNPIRLLETILVKTLYKVYDFQIKPSLHVVSGRKSIPANVAIGASSLIRAHNLDYDMYLRVRGGCNYKKKGHILFIDQNLCFHVEFDSQPISPIKYFPALCHALHAIGLAIQAPVLIAAHPRYCSIPEGDWFQGIPVEYGNTAELVRDCSVVVGHFSTALQMAVLFNKPIIFLTTNEIEAAIGLGANHLANTLGKTPINIDRDISDVDWNRELLIDPISSSSYKNKYIKMDGTPEKSACEIVIDHIENNFTENQTP